MVIPQKGVKLTISNFNLLLHKKSVIRNGITDKNQTIIPASEKGNISKMKYKDSEIKN